MKLNFQNISVERSKVFQSSNFSIGDTRIILEILRGKIYSNPIQTICQEISTNARDAHVEIGKGDLPIEIKLPNKLEPSFYIRDYGPGITPDRMENIFIRYGCSTKRDDDTLCGAYGLGSKSPFSYTDSFTIITITPENNGLTKREYIAHIDESGLGQLSLVKEESSSDPQGTTILIYPKLNDFPTFAIHTKRATSHWKVRPKILGDPNFQWPEIRVAYKGTDWELHDVSPLEQVPYALIEGIPYNINLRHIYPTGHAQLTNIPLRLLFKIGEVPVTANREEIDYQTSVIAYLKTRLERALNELKTMLAASLVNAQSLKAAVVLWQELKRKTYGHLLLAQVSWKNIDLGNFENIRLGTFDVQVQHFRRDSYTAFGCRKMSDSHNLHINATTLLVEDDLKAKGIARARLASLFDMYPKLTHITVIDFSKKIDKETLPNGDVISKVNIVDDTIITARKKQAEKDIHYSQLEVVVLSGIPKKKIVFETDPNKKKYKIVKVKKLIGESEDNCGWAEVEDEVIENKKHKLYIVLSNKMVLWKGKEVTTEDSKLQTRQLFYIIDRLNQIIKITDPAMKVKLEIYGVLPSFLTKIEDNWQPFYPVAEKILHKYKEQLPKEFGSDYAITRTFNTWLCDIITKDKFTSKLDPGSTLIKFVKASQAINDAASKVGLYNDLVIFFNQQYVNQTADNQKELKKLREQALSEYPILQNISHYGAGQSVMENELLLYIQTKDSLKNGPK